MNQFSISGLAWAAVSLLTLKGVVEPLAAYWGQRAAQRLVSKTQKFMPLLFRRLDPAFPQAMQELTPDGLTSWVRDSLLALEIKTNNYLTTEEEEAVISDVFLRHDPLKNAEATPIHEDLSNYHQRGT